MPLKNSPITMHNSETFDLKSSIVDDTYRLFVALPADYGQSEKSYPVVYAASGNSHIFTLRQIAYTMNMSGELPSLIIVGIGYPTEDPADIWQRRTRDYNPTPDEDQDNRYLELFGLETIQAGGANNFLKFIYEELKPFVNSTYRTMPDDSTYVGFSGGGMFGLYALFTQPDMFSRYVIGSPTIFRANKAILKNEAAYAIKHDDLPARVFLSVGEREETDDPFILAPPSNQFVTNVKELVQTLQDRKYPSLNLSSYIFEGETHLSVIPATLSRGLRTVFE